MGSRFEKRKRDVLVGALSLSEYLVAREGTRGRVALDSAGGRGRGRGRGRAIVVVAMEG